MHRYHVLQALRAAKLSALEEGALLAGPLLILAGLVTAIAVGDPGGLARVLGLVGLAGLLTCAASRAVRRYRAGTTALLPTSVARVFVRTRPPRVVTALTGVLALGLPLAAGVAVVSLVGWGWLVVAGVLLLGCGGMLVTWLTETRRGEAPSTRSSAAASELLGRLCMRADMPVPASSSRRAPSRSPGRPVVASTSRARWWSCSTTPSSRRCSPTSSRTSRIATPR